ncbi:uncharacterized protein EI97DRAFT_287593 [Westerdykella ornata]|uniref:Uncharacterized protein n=1 Tax=Westerdykella ornata TaxID=318751 RepID=A0A6A6JM69_WESOR|nr:uncharacterized protein EI97DRAFT_287593 [Westerdykella ornata]KAF2277325.1 hypothetical protein EI97DRAFT_287593 [Westerdykella ornata]
MKLLKFIIGLVALADTSLAAPTNVTVTEVDLAARGPNDHHVSDFLNLGLSNELNIHRSLLATWAIGSHASICQCMRDKAIAGGSHPGTKVDASLAMPSHSSCPRPTLRPGTAGSLPKTIAGAVIPATCAGPCQTLVVAMSISPTSASMTCEERFDGADLGWYKTRISGD